MTSHSAGSVRPTRAVFRSADVAEPAAPRRRGAGKLSRRLFGALAWTIRHGAWRARMLEFSLPLIERELRSTVHVPWRHRPGMWRRGFLSESRVLYDLGANDWRPYLTDRERFVGTRTINGDYRLMLDDKLLFARLLAGEAAVLPELFGVVRQGRVVNAEDGRRVAGTLADLAWRHGELVVKPATGGGGVGFVRLSAGGDGNLRRNGAVVTADALQRLATACEGSMVTEYVRQHPEIAALYPRTTNTVRLITMQDESCEAFVAAAVLRMGCARSEPTDNWTQGGLSAPVDLASGVLGPAASYPAHGDRVVRHTRHPETGTPIAGFRLPGWTALKEGILAITRRYPILRYVGWDLAVTDDGFRIIEGNSYSDVNLFQIHHPLLADPRIAAFFQRHGALRRRRTATEGSRVAARGSA